MEIVTSSACSRSGRWRIHKEFW